MNLLNPFKPFELFFNLNGYGGFNILGGYTLVSGGDKNIGYGDIRVALPGKHPVAVSPNDQNYDRKHQDTYPLPDGGIGNYHLAISAGLVTFFTTFSLWPSSTLR
jgi:hypothetical protein